MAVNYTPEMVDLMKSRYSANPTRETVEELAEASPTDITIKGVSSVNGSSKSIKLPYTSSVDI